MKVDSIIKWFMPKEERFHELLAKDTENLLKAARVFSEVAKSASLEERRVKVVQLKALEHDGDQITRQIFEALNSSFITPLDREDIRSLATDLDDIVDYVEGVGQSLILFGLSGSPEALRQFAEILVAMTGEIERATEMVWDLSNEGDIHTALVRVSELENQADRLYATVIADLFRDDRNPIEILKRKEVYDGLEEACDACKDFTHVLGSVVIKSS
jgi:predicted phosphate transport protein (TIGR00153 family)